MTNRIPISALQEKNSVSANDLHVIVDSVTNTTKKIKSSTPVTTFNALTANIDTLNIDTSLSVGFDGTLWASPTYKAIGVKNGSLASISTNVSTHLVHNAYNDGTGWKLMTSSYTSMIALDNTGGVSIYADTSASPPSLGFPVSYTRNLYITGKGCIYAPSIHNNAFLTTDTSISSGTYTPTLVGIQNITGTPTVSSACSWMRVGNVVTVAGRLTANSTTTVGTSIVKIPLPIASNLAVQGDLSGGGHSTEQQFPWKVYAEATSNTAYLEGYPTATGNSSFMFHFQYVVL